MAVSAGITPCASSFLTPCQASSSPSTAAMYSRLASTASSVTTRLSEIAPFASRIAAPPRSSSGTMLSHCRPKIPCSRFTRSVWSEIARYSSDSAARFSTVGWNPFCIAMRIAPVRASWLTRKSSASWIRRLISSTPTPVAIEALSTDSA